MNDDDLLLIPHNEPASQSDRDPGTISASPSIVPREMSPTSPPATTQSTVPREMTPTSSNSLRRRQPADRKPRVGIIGTGNYAQALAKRLTTLAGYDVIIGSRKPELRRGTLSATLDFSCGVSIASVEDCVTGSDVVVVAIHREDFEATLQDVAHLTAGKLVVDVSNRESRKVEQSNAEYLASILPDAAVVKAFNSVSAYTMEDISSTGDSSIVYVAGNDPGARKKVMTLAEDMGFRVVNLGLLTSARSMEDNVLETFSMWKMPTVLTTAIFVVISLVIVYICFIPGELRPGLWEQIFMFLLNKSICMTAMTTLALTYLPGQLAGVLQIYYGTKHRRFPQFLDTWLKCRKQLGLIAFFLTTLHAVMSVILLSPSYYYTWYHEAAVTIPANSTFTYDLVLTPTRQKMNWRGELICLLGILGFVLMGVVALTSIRSIGDTLNWREWRFVQSHLGYVVLAVSTAHLVVVCYRGWVYRGFPDILKSLSFWSAVLPFTVLAMKLVFSLPPLSGYLHKIRRGWEREGARYGDYTGLTSVNHLRKQANDGCCSRGEEDEAVNTGAPGETSQSGVNIDITEEPSYGDSVTGNSCNGKYGGLELDQVGARPGQSSLQSPADWSDRL